MKYKAMMNILDLETGEIKELDQFTQGLAEADFEEMVQRIIVLKDLFTTVTGLYRVNEFKFLQMMADREAKKYVNDEVEIRLSPQADYEYDVNCIHQLKELINKEDFDRIFTEQYKVNRNLLRTIYTLGGDIKKLIDEMETKNERKPTVSMKLK